MYKYILSHRYYAFEGRPGIHTRLRDVSRDKRKELVLAHLAKNKKGQLKDFQDIFPELKAADISNLLRDIKSNGKIIHEGSRKKGGWRLS